MTRQIGTPICEDLALARDQIKRVWADIAAQELVYVSQMVMRNTNPAYEPVYRIQQGVVPRNRSSRLHSHQIGNHIARRLIIPLF